VACTRVLRAGIAEPDDEQLGGSVAFPAAHRRLR
jgi:hypothetical protein